VVHLDGLDLTLFVCRHEGYFHSLLHDAGLNASYRHGADTADTVDILDREPKRLVGRFLGFLEGVKRLKKRGAGIPGRLRALLGDIDPLKGTDGDEQRLCRLVSHHLEEGREILLHFLEAFLVILGCVHLVDSNDELVDAKRS